MMGYFGLYRVGKGWKVLLGDGIDRQRWVISPALGLVVAAWLVGLLVYIPELLIGFLESES